MRTASRRRSVRESDPPGEATNILTDSPEGLRGWVKQAKIDRGEGPAGALTTAEREELVRLRRKVREQEATIEVLGKATAFAR